MKSKVYFREITTENPSLLSQAAEKLVSYLATDLGHVFPKAMPIKVHFGEKGNDTFIRPESYEGIIRYLQAKKIETCYIETNVLYRGERTTKEAHLNIAKAHGFTQIPIVIADGEKGEDYVNVDIHQRYFKTCKIGKAFLDYEGFLVASHFKGHGMAGFGGAMKQLAMGFAARGGKLSQHSEISPLVDDEKCISCGACADQCDVDAITMDSIAVIDGEKCIGCAGCIAVCPVGAIRNDWTGANFKKKLAEYALGAQQNKDNIYVNFLINITKLCDCVGKHLDKVVPNIGIVASKDPVAADRACLDLIAQKMGRGFFEEGEETLIYAEEIGVGQNAYELIEI